MFNVLEITLLVYLVLTSLQKLEVKYEFLTFILFLLSKKLDELY